MRDLYPFLALYRRYFARISLGIILAIVTLLASIGLLTLSGWFLAGTAVAGLSAAYINYMLPAAGVRGSAIIRTFGRYAERLLSHDTTFRVLAQLRVFTFTKLLPLTPGAIAKFKQAEILNRLVADVDTLDHLYLRLLSPIATSLVVICLVTFGLYFIDPTLAFTLGGTLSVLILAIPLVFYYAGKPIGIRLTEFRSQYRIQLTSWLQGNAELAIFNALPRFRERLNSIEQRWLTEQKRLASLNGLSMLFITLASGLTSILILWLAAGGINGSSSATPLIALFVFASLAAFETLAPVSGAFLHLGQVISSAKRVNELLSEKAEVVFTDRPSSAPALLAELRLNNVTFRYPGQPQPVLNDLNLHIKAHQHIAVVGKTGCGKSTLLQLLTRAWDPEVGQIFINDQEISLFDEKTLRSTMSVISQRVHIFSATLRHNLLIANPNADDNQLTMILAQVGLDEIVNKEGLDLWLGEGGRQLSGGEQRRIGIARALLHQGPLLLLDEPTEGLDAQTERQILSTLRQHAKDKTLIMITHRLSGLDSMDNIIVMDDGKIVETGDHLTLLKRNGLYHQFVKG